jgi:hypothetical protein
MESRHSAVSANTDTRTLQVMFSATRGWYLLGIRHPNLEAETLTSGSLTPG